MEDDFDINLDDPRDELVLKLIEYKKYKEAASNLQELEETRNLFYTRPPADLSGYQSNQQLALFELDVNVYDMLGAFQKMLRRKQLNAPLHTKVSKQEISIRESMTNVITTLKSIMEDYHFMSSFQQETKPLLLRPF